MPSRALPILREIEDGERGTSAGFNARSAIIRWQRESNARGEEDVSELCFRGLVDAEGAQNSAKECYDVPPAAFRPSLRAVRGYLQGEASTSR
jgi:hypothetical protein